MGQSPLESSLCPSGGHCATTPCLVATLFASLFIGTVIESLVDQAVSNSLFSNSCFVWLAAILWGLMPPSWWCWLFACASTDLPVVLSAGHECVFLHYCSSMYSFSVIFLLIPYRLELLREIHQRNAYSPVNQSFIELKQTIYILGGAFK